MLQCFRTLILRNQPRSPYNETVCSDFSAVTDFVAFFCSAWQRFYFLALTFLCKYKDKDKDEDSISEKMCLCARPLVHVKIMAGGDVSDLSLHRRSLIRLNGSRSLNVHSMVCRSILLTCLEAYLR